jgi:hypothetical protein
VQRPKSFRAAVEARPADLASPGGASREDELLLSTLVDQAAELERHSIALARAGDVIAARAVVNVLTRRPGLFS